jgi:xylan 1,4-beta-xylosidase
VAGSKFHYLYVSHDVGLGKHIRVMSCSPDQLQWEVLSDRVSIPVGCRRICAWKRISSASIVLTATKAGTGPIARAARCDPGTPNFTGGVCWPLCSGSGGARGAGDFDYFMYRQRSYRADPFSEAPAVAWA